MSFTDSAIRRRLTLTETAPAAEAGSALMKLRRSGLYALAAQLVLMVGWSVFEVHRYAETSDFAGFYRAWYLIGHGNLNPGPAWLSGGSGWWATQGIFIQWPLALLAVIAPQPVTLLIIQDAAVFLAEAVAYFWLLDIARERSLLPLREVAIFGIAIIVLNPWTYWAISGDYHSEAIGTLFMLLASRAFYYHRRSAWVWAALTLVSGLVSATYLLGVAIGLLLVRGSRRSAVGLGVGTVIWLFVMLKLGVGGGLLAGSHHETAREASDPLGSALHEINVVIQSIPSLWPQIAYLIAPALFIGVLSAPTIGVAAVVIGTSATTGLAGLSQFFQNIALYIYMPVGTVIILATVSRRFGVKQARVAMAVIVISSTAWCSIWLAQVPAHYIHVSGNQVAAIETASRLVPANGNLLVSQGISGVLGGRDLIQPLASDLPEKIEVPKRGAWWLITPYDGVEPEDVRTSATIISALKASRHTKLVFERDGVWLFHWLPTKQRTVLVMSRPDDTFPAAVFETQGVRDVKGAAAEWTVTSQRAGANVLYGDYWDEPIGHYEGHVSLTSRAPVIVRLWNSTTNEVLETRRIQSTRGLRVVRMQGQVTSLDPATDSAPYRGVGPFAILPISAPPGNNLELTVQALTNAPVTVHSVGLGADSAHR